MIAYINLLARNEIIKLRALIQIYLATLIKTTTVRSRMLCVIFHASVSSLPIYECYGGIKPVLLSENIPVLMDNSEHKPSPLHQCLVRLP